MIVKRWLITMVMFLGIQYHTFAEFYGVMPQIGVKLGVGLGTSESLWRGYQEDLFVNPVLRPSFLAGIEVNAVFIWSQLSGSLGVNGYASLFHKVHKDDGDRTIDVRWQEYLVDVMAKVAIGDELQFYAGVGAGALFTTKPILHWQNQGFQETWPGDNRTTPVLTWELGIYFAMFNVALRGYVNPMAWQTPANHIANKYQVALLFGLGLPFHPYWYS